MALPWARITNKILDLGNSYWTQSQFHVNEKQNKDLEVTALHHKATVQKVSTWLQVLEAPPLIQFSMNSFEKTAKRGPNTWVSVIQVGDQDGVLGLALALVAIRKVISTSLYIFLTFCKQIFNKHVKIYIWRGFFFWLGFIRISYLFL